MALVLILFAALVCLRMPEIVIKGRFWAEEGRYFYHDAWVMPPLQALLAPVGGYLNIVANASTLAARWLLPLRLAPYLTIAAALAVPPRAARRCLGLPPATSGCVRLGYALPGCCCCSSCRLPRRSGCRRSTAS